MYRLVPLSLGQGKGVRYLGQRLFERRTARGEVVSLIPHHQITVLVRAGFEGRAAVHHVLVSTLLQQMEEIEVTTTHYRSPFHVQHL